MHPRTTSGPLRHPCEKGGTAVTALERRINELERLARAQGRELSIQFERIAQLQAQWDILRIRFISPELGRPSGPSANESRSTRLV